MNASTFTNVKLVDGALEVEFEDGKLIRFEDCWLRDSCRCGSCYQAGNFQRALHLLDVPEHAMIDKIHYDTSDLWIEWSDKHESVYTPEFLSQFDYKTWRQSRRLKPILWHGSTIGDKVARIHVDKFLNSVDGSRGVFQSLLDYGVALIEGVDASLEATEKVCRALGGIQHTLFGGMYRFNNVLAEHADSAYTNQPLPVHNDSTYFTEAAGLQILHLLEHSNGTGGETVLVDGFYGAMRLQEDCPASYEFLSTFDVEAEYLEDGHHYKYSAPVIQVDRKTEDVKQIRFNSFDRSPMAFSNSLECRTYYRSLRKLALYYENPDNQWQFKLNPGMVLVMDNFRVLHGRTSVTGYRELCGSYVSRSDWLNKARTLHLIQ